MVKTKVWKNITASVVALALVFGAGSILGQKYNVGSVISVSASEGGSESETAFKVVQAPNGTVEAEYTEAHDGVVIKAVPDEGYVINAVLVNGEQIAINDQDQYVIALDAYESLDSIVITADFVAKNSILIETAANGTIGYERIPEEDAIEIIAEPDEGYEVAGVFVNGQQIAINDQDRYLMAVPASEEFPLRITAEFAEKQYKITVEQPANGTVSADKQEAAAEDTVLITAAPNAGFKVGKVMMNGEQIAINDQGQYLIAMPKADVTITAEFVAEADVAPEKDSSPKTGATAGIAAGTAVIAAAAAAMVVFKKRK